MSGRKPHQITATEILRINFSPLGILYVDFIAASKFDG
jgi:hypothetical protein